MTIEIKVPALGESVSEAQIAKLYKQSGDAVAADELIVELETDKVTLEVNAPSSGVITEIKVSEGDDVKVNDLVALMEEGAAAAKPQNNTAKAVDNAATSVNKASASDNLSPAPKKLQQKIILILVKLLVVVRMVE